LSNPLNIAIAGLGTVGSGTVRLLREQEDILARRCGRRIRVTAVSARDRGRNRDIDISGYDWFEDAAEMAREADAEVVVELIGGSDGIAKAVCEAAISAGRHVVTANKALVALHGTALARAAEDKGVSLSYEAAVAGGIPIIKCLREALAANRIQRIYGILNGTSNYILSTMRESGRSFDEVLADAQRLGYAEADPGFDVDGIDAAHKLAILTSVAFGTEVDFAGVHTEGIRHVSPLDIEYADELGYRIKLLATARRTEHGVEQRVHPCMVPEGAAIATVDGVLNAVVAVGDFAGPTVYEGQGAGAGPTASAVAADIVDIARGIRAPVFGVPAVELEKASSAPMNRHRGSYYIRLMVTDRPGVLAGITASFRDEEVSMESLLQRARSPDEAVPVVLTSHETEEEGMMRALGQIAAMDSVLEPPCMIRIEDL
jgi:homoserine dehydrogenase